MSYIWSRYTAQDLLGEFDLQTLTFTIVDTNGQINEIVEYLRHYLDPLIQRYPWFNQPPEWKRYNWENVDYIHGYLSHGGNNNEQLLMIYWMWNLSKKIKGCYLRLWDLEDTDVLFVINFSQVPEWINPDNSLNRIWVSNGAALVIDEDPNEGLLLKDAIRLLRLNKYTILKDWTQDFVKDLESNSSLQELFMDQILDVQVSLSRELISIFNEQPCLIGQSIYYFFKNNLSVNKNASSDRETIPIAMHKDLDFILNALMERSQSKDKCEFIGDVLSIGFKNCVDEDVDMEVSNSTSALARDDLQEFLIGCGILDKKVDVNIKESDQNMDTVINSLSDLFTSKQPDENVDEKIKSFFQKESGFEGIDVPVSDDEDSDGVSETDNETNEEDEFDLDDFLEYHAKHSMGLSDDDLKKFRADNKKRSISTLKDYNDDSDYQTDTSTEYRSDEDGEEELQNEVEEFKKLLATNPLARNLYEKGIGNDNW